MPALPGRYWRSLEELAESPVFEEFVRREYPTRRRVERSGRTPDISIRSWCASLALAGLSGCVIQPPVKIIPYIKQPEEEVPDAVSGSLLSFTLGGVATPVLCAQQRGPPDKD
jgi:molybdopterin-containing oxidoreductase family iron-sulfur binding subunit